LTRRILHVIADAQFGGAQWYLIELARVQRARGDKVTILSGDEGPLLVEYGRAADRHIQDETIRRELGPSDIAAARVVTALAREHDVVHAHASKALAACVLPPNRRAPVWSAHGYDSAHAEFGRWARAPLGLLKAMLARRASAISAASLNVAAKIVAAGVRKHRVRVIYTGVRTDRFRAVPDVDPRPPIVVGAAGRLVGIKGFDVLLTAAARVAAQGLDASFEIYGNGPKEEELRSQMRSLSLDGRARIHPATDDLPSALASMHVVAVPSRLDSFPLVPCEAMVAGRPIIATRVGGLPEAFEDGVHGLLVPPDDADALARAIASLVVSPERIAVMGRAAREYASERYRWERVADEYDELYSIAT
jgi:glycosyltransferase involved in cell wall biosynthesis